MREALIQSIIENKNRKESLISLKNNLDKNETLSQDGLLEICKRLVSDPDPKIRKNSILILGHFKKNNLRQFLINAYYQEDTDFVKEAYFKALSHFNCKPVLDDLKQIQQNLLHDKESHSKHIQSQLKILNPLIIKNSEHKRKMLKLIHQNVDVILTTLPFYQFTLFEDVLHLKYKPVGQGVLVRSKSLYDLFPLRNYGEMIIPLRHCLNLEKDADVISQAIIQSNLVELLDNLFDQEDFFYYKLTDNLRVKDSSLLNKIVNRILRHYPTKLLNSKTDYEIELILRELKLGKVNVYLKLTCVDNPRFEYRKEVISNSMQPYIANTLVKLAKPYLSTYAHVLDPFVGSSVLLIERCLELPVKFALGLDIYGKAIEASKKNIKAAGLNIHLTMKDCNRFVPTDLFDEIFTDMPTYAQMPDKKVLDELYREFFRRIPRNVRAEGYVFIYTSEIALVEKYLRIQRDYLNLIEHYDIPRGKHMFYFFIIQVR